MCTFLNSSICSFKNLNKLLILNDLNSSSEKFKVGIQSVLVVEGHCQICMTGFNCVFTPMLGVARDRPPGVIIFVQLELSFTL